MQPHRIKVGSAVILVSLDGLALDWGVEEKYILRMLHQFGDIPLITPMEGGKQYINLWAFEMALFEAGLPNACLGSQEAVRAIHASAGIVYGTLTKQAIRDRMSRLQRDLSQSGPHTNKKIKKPGTGAGIGRKRRARSRLQDYRPVSGAS